MKGTDEMHTEKVSNNNNNKMHTKRTAEWTFVLWPNGFHFRPFARAINSLHQMRTPPYVWKALSRILRIHPPSPSSYTSKTQPNTHNKQIEYECKEKRRERGIEWDEEQNRTFFLRFVRFSCSCRFSCFHSFSFARCFPKSKEEMKRRKKKSKSGYTCVCAVYICWI